MNSLRCGSYALGLLACINLSAQWSATVLNPPGATFSSVGVVYEGYQGGQTAAGAAVWTGTPGSLVNLNPSGANSSSVKALTSTQQGGTVSIYSSTPAVRAALWSGTAASHISLVPAGYDGWSSVNAMSETQQGGYVSTAANPGMQYAALWSGTAESFVNLHPGGIYTTGSAIMAMSSTQQGGIGRVDYGFRRAVLWSGSAESAVYLHASGATALNDSGVLAMTETAQGGFVSFTWDPYHSRAAMWFGDPDSRIDLHPTGKTYSEVRAMADGFQAGVVNDQAAVWTGSAASYLNLHGYVTDLLGSDFTRSTINGAYFDEGSLYLVGTATDPTHALNYAMMWTLATPIPEPSTYGLVAGLVTLGLAAWRRRRTQG